MTSFKEIAHSIDLLYPPKGLRDLAMRFRYPEMIPGNIPLGPISLKRLAGRVKGNQVKKIELLHYNTYLLRANIQLLDFVKIGIGLGRFMVCCGITPAQLLEKVLKHYSSSDICDKLFPPVKVFGVPTDPVNLACRATGSVTSLASFILEKLDWSIEKIIDILEVPEEIIVDVISSITGIRLVDVYRKDKDQITNRAIEIGQQVFHFYDLVSLCEVWLSESRGYILRERPGINYFIGPRDPQPGEWEHLGSGLLVFSPTYSIADGGSHKYSISGVSRQMPGGCDFGALVDSDKWAFKGIQLTLVDIGYGFIELYSTHLYSGGDMPDFCNRIVREPSDNEKSDVRAVQVEELAQFIKATHKPWNVAVIMGDFNIREADHRKELYNTLNKFEEMKFDDWYSLEVFSKIYLDTNDNLIADPGQTNIDLDNDPGRSCDSICQIYSNLYPDEFTNNQEKLPQGSDYYCVETKTSSGDGSRYDYIFVQRPVTSHTFNLDVSRIRRRAFKRPVNHGGTINYMSDHLGLEVTLFVSPRNA